jgi:hypothetical protein
MTAIQELGHALTPLEVHSPVSFSDKSNTFLENLQLEIEARNNQIASALSLVHNKPDEEGRTRVQQEKDRLRGLSREKWERTKNPIMVGDDVFIPVGTPVGLGSDWASYITEKPLQGTLISASGGYGGSGYLESSQQILEPLFKVAVLSNGSNPEAFTLLVPNDLITPLTTQI